MGVGLQMAQEMMKQNTMAGTNAPPAAAGSSMVAAPGTLPDLLSPADVAKALGVGEPDVMAAIDSGELKRKKNRLNLAYHARCAERIPALLTATESVLDPKDYSTCTEICNERLSTSNDEVQARQNIPAPSAVPRPPGTPPSRRAVCAYCGTISPASSRRTARSCANTTWLPLWRRAAGRARLAGRKRSPSSARVVRQFRCLIRASSPSGASSADPAPVPYEEINQTIRPESMLPFKLPETDVRDAFVPGTDSAGSLPIGWRDGR